MSNRDEAVRWVTKALDCFDDARILLDYKKQVGTISRIYYANLYCAKSLFALDGKVVKTHNAAIGNFGKIYVKTGKMSKRYGRLLNKMLGLRRRSDYSVDPKLISRKKIKGYMNTTKSFIVKCQKHIQNSKK